MEIHQLFDPPSCTYSYLLWDKASHNAALIDPVENQVLRDVRLIREHGLVLRYTLETHVHADHVTGSGLLRKTFGSLVMVHENCGFKCPDLLLREGDRIPLGEEKIRVIHTPGHTDNDVCYRIPGSIFTGDVLLIRGCGRTDLQSGDAGTMYDSITGRLFTLPDETVVFPGHEYDGNSFSTIIEEKTHNPRIGNGTSRQEFIATMNSLALDPPERMHEVLPTNLRCGIPDTESPAPLPPL